MNIILFSVITFIWIVWISRKKSFKIVLSNLGVGVLGICSYSVLMILTAVPLLAFIEILAKYGFLSNLTGVQRYELIIMYITYIIGMFGAYVWMNYKLFKKLKR